MAMHDSSKRQRLSDAPVPEGQEGEHIHAPSLVVHVRGLPDGIVEGELRAAVQKFGPVACVLLIPRKRQALVEFENLQSAIDCVNFASKNTIQLRGTSVYFNYSTSERIIRSPFEPNRQEEPSEVNNVLLCTIMNPAYPITCDVMHAITHNVAQPIRCVIFRKNGVQSMIEFATPQEASRVRQQLNGADIYSGCCTLKIEYAKPKKLNVFKNDNETSWDWVTPNLDPGASRHHGSGLLPDPSLGSPPFGSYGAYPPAGSACGPGYEDRRPHTVSGFYPSTGYTSSTGYETQSYHSGGGNGHRSGSSSDELDSRHRQTHRSAGGRDGGDGDIGIPPMSVPPQSRGQSFAPGSRLPMQPGCVMLVYGLAEKWNCDKLFSILCMYGNVVRIKFLKSKEGSAMVQLAQVEQVENTISALSGMSIYSGRLNIHHSRQLYIEEFGGRPASLPDLTPAYKDYYKPPYIALQRFSTAESAAKNRLQSPSNVLHFFNAPPNVTEEQVIGMLAGSGAPAPVKVRMLQGKSEKSSSGLMQFDSTDQAIEALLAAQHQPFYIPGATSKPPYTFKLCFSSMQP